jgi:hypothetical protein
VRAGQEIGTANSLAQRYLYMACTSGSVSYLSGTVSNGRFNYNLLLDEMQFIDLKGDTLSLASATMLNHVKVGEDLFYYHPEHAYLEVIADANPVKLARKRFLAMADNEKEAAYGYVGHANPQLVRHRQQPVVPLQTQRRRAVQPRRVVFHY